MAKDKEVRDYYEMRRGKEVLCGSTVPNLGYPPAWLKDMARNGIHLYKNGKRVRLCDICT
jgi:hypothetical protein